MKPGITSYPISVHVVITNWSRTYAGWRTAKGTNEAQNQAEEGDGFSEDKGYDC